MEDISKTLEAIGPESVEADLGLSDATIWSSMEGEDIAMAELTDEQKEKILSDIIELTSPPGRPENSITAEEYHDALVAKGEKIALGTARSRLRKAVVAGKLEMTKVQGIGYWRKQSSPS